jgi:hypothetical protein
MPTDKELRTFHSRLLTVVKLKLPKDLEDQAIAAITEKFLGGVQKGKPANRSWQAATVRVKKPINFRHNSKAERARDAAEAAIKETGQAVPLYKLTEAIEARGVHLGGTHPSRRLSAILGASSKFASTREGWKLADAAAEPKQKRPPKIVGASGTTYIDLAIRALTIEQHPIGTGEIIAFLRQFRPLPDPLDRKTILSITSALSHDDRFQNLKWGGSRRWWIKDWPLPQDPVGNNGHAMLQTYEPTTEH